MNANKSNKLEDDIFEDSSDFTTGSIPKKMLKFMLPILGALVLQAMYGAVDILIVGNFGTKAGISGVSTGSNVVNLVVFTITGLSMGVTILIGKYIGENRREKIGKLIGAAICFFAVLAVLLSIVMIVFARPLVIMMQSPKDAVELGVMYVRICGGGIVFIIAYNLISSIFRGLGNSTLPLVFVGIACAVNIILDLVFVMVCGMNVVGAALATVIAQAVSVVLSLIIIRRKSLPFSMTKSDISFNSEIKRFVIVGSPIAFQEIMTQVSFLALCAFINGLGMDESSGYGVANKIVSFVMLIPAAIMQSMSSIVAQNVGANLEKRSRKSMVTGMIIGGSIGVFVAFFVYFGGATLSSIFSKDSGVILQSADYLKGFCTEAVLTCILFSFIGYYNGHGQTLFVMLQGLAQTFIVRLPMSYLMSIREDATLSGIGLAAPSATVFGIVINIVFFAIYNYRMNSEENLKKYK